MKPRKEYLTSQKINLSELWEQIHIFKKKKYETIIFLQNWFNQS